MDQEIVILSEVSQTWDDKYCMILFICGILRKGKVNLFTKKKVTDIENKFMITRV